MDKMTLVSLTWNVCHTNSQHTARYKYWSIQARGQMVNYAFDIVILMLCNILQARRAML